MIRRVATAALRGRRRVDIMPVPTMMSDELVTLQGREVEVVYEGMVYRGRLVGADETDLYLVTPAGSCTLPLSGINSVRAAA